jgi:hypothetical protein
MSDMSTSYREVRLRTDSDEEFVLKGATPTQHSIINSLPWGSEVAFQLKPAVTNPPDAVNTDPYTTVEFLEGSVLCKTLFIKSENRLWHLT